MHCSLSKADAEMSGVTFAVHLTKISSYLVKRLTHRRVCTIQDAYRCAKINKKPPKDTSHKWFMVDL